MSDDIRSKFTERFGNFLVLCSLLWLGSFVCRVMIEVGFLVWVYSVEGGFTPLVRDTLGSVGVWCAVAFVPALYVYVTGRGLVKGSVVARVSFVCGASLCVTLLARGTYSKMIDLSCSAYDKTSCLFAPSVSVDAAFASPWVLFSLPLGWVTCRILTDHLSRRERNEEPVHS